MMIHMAVFLRWITLTLFVMPPSNNTSLTALFREALTFLLELLSLVFLIVGVVAFWRARGKHGKKGSQEKYSRLPLTRSSLQQQTTSIAQPVRGIAPPIALAVPVVVLLLVWLAAVMPIYGSVGSNRPTPVPTKPVKPTPLSLKPPNTALVNPDTLTIGINTNSPQQTYVDPGTHKMAGFDIDLITAIAQKMKLSPKFIKIPTDFPAVLSPLDAKTVDVVISAYALTPEVTSSTLSVPYLFPSEVVLVPSQNPALTQFKQLSDLCGHTIGVLANSEEDFQLQNAKTGCKPLETITIKELPDSDGVAKALSKGQVDATYQDSPTSVYYSSRYPGAFKQIGKIPGTEEGILIRNDNSVIINDVQKAFSLLRGDNTYMTLLKKWQLVGDALSTSVGAIIPQCCLYT